MKTYFKNSKGIILKKEAIIDAFNNTSKQIIFGLNLDSKLNLQYSDTHGSGKLESKSGPWTKSLFKVEIGRSGEVDLKIGSLGNSLSKEDQVKQAKMIVNAVAKANKIKAIETVGDIHKKVFNGPNRVSKSKGSDFAVS